MPDDNPEGKQSRPPTDDELRLLWTLAPNQLPAQHVHLLRLAFLLGKRVSEMLGALKTEVNLGKHADWFIPGARGGNKSGEDQRVPLPQTAVLIRAPRRFKWVV